MSDFSKIYTAEELIGNKTVTLLSLPMEESIMVPVAWTIDLMRQGQNVLYFTFDHDSIKVNEFFKMALANYTKEEAKCITGNLAIIDLHQIPEGMSWRDFLKETIMEVKSECELNFVFFDVMKFIGSEQEDFFKTLSDISFLSMFTKIIIDTANAPLITAIQGVKEHQKEVKEFADTTLSEMYKESKMLVDNSSFVLGIKRERKSFWKKIINFLLFWRKSNNFVLKVLKNRNGKKKSYRMNLDMDTSKTEIL